MADKLTDTVKALADILNDTGLTEIEYENEGCHIRVVKNIVPAMPSQPITMTVPVAAPAAAPAAPSAGPSSAAHPGVVPSPMVGTAYLASEPGAAPFVKVGDQVSEGQTLLILEAMKVMNPIRAPRSGKVIEIFAKDATPVEYGEPLLIIE